MSNEILAFLGGSTVGAIVSTSINAFVTYKTTQSNQNFQLELEHQKHQREQVEKELTEQKRMLLEIYQLLSKISREFSLTGINIKQEAQITAEQYDAAYSETCASCDLISAYCDLFFPDLSRDIDRICGEMNIFWGIFKNYLYLWKTQADHKLKQSKMDELVTIANKIDKHIGTVKYQLSSIMAKTD